MDDLTPPEIVAQAQSVTDNLLPPKSKEKYLAAYEVFLQWKNAKKALSFSENVFLAYFNELAQRYKPSSLWCTYSMLKSTVKMKHDIDLKHYANLTAFLKRRSDGYIAQKSKVLSPNDVEKFLKEAPDNQYLATKVALVFGVHGACRRQELSEMSEKDVETHGNMLLVKIKNTKNKIPRSFVIQGPFCDIVKKNEALRSTKKTTDRFFQNFQNGKCTAQPIGINKFGAMPRVIARYLNLPEPDSYTGHSFRRTSATLLADSGADVLTLKRHGGWRSTPVAESYVENSIRSKLKISEKITSSINLEPQAKKSRSPEKPLPSTSTFSDNYLDTISISDQPCPTYSLSPTFTQITQENNEVINTNSANTITQTVKIPSKTNQYHFENCTFTNCFNN